MCMCHLASNQEKKVTIVLELMRRAQICKKHFNFGVRMRRHAQISLRALDYKILDVGQARHANEIPTT